MPEQTKEPSPVKAENAKQPETSEAKLPKKVWKTPRVIVSAARDSEAKGGNLPELSLSSSPNTGTPNS